MLGRVLRTKLKPCITKHAFYHCAVAPAFLVLLSTGELTDVELADTEKLNPKTSTMSVMFRYEVPSCVEDLVPKQQYSELGLLRNEWIERAVTSQRNDPLIICNL